MASTFSHRRTYFPIEGLIASFCHPWRGCPSLNLCSQILKNHPMNYNPKHLRTRLAQVIAIVSLCLLGMPTLPAYSATTTLMGGENQLTVASYNVENLDPKRESIEKVDQKRASNVDDDLGKGRFKTIATQIVENLKSPDIIALQEVQDNDGAEISSETKANKTGEALIKAIQTAGGPTYQYGDVAPTNGQDGGQPGGNIRTGFLINPARVQFNGTLTRLPDSGEFKASRKPLVGQFKFGNQSITIINNHFVSKKGGATSDNQRIQQAQTVNGFVKSALAKEAKSNVIVLGDINDTPESATLEKLAGSELKSLMSLVPIADRYTYIFKGNKELIDHILVSPQLLRSAAVEILHINNGDNTQKASDHDPIVSRYDLSGSKPTPIDPDNGSGEKIFEDLTGAPLLEKLATQYAPKASLGYRAARDVLYTTIDNQNGVLTDLYGGFTVQLDPNDPTPRTTAGQLNINAEHVWPQSKGAQDNAKSDLHNLYASVINTNSDRSSLPFADIPDPQTTSWYINDQEIAAQPTTNINAYSESDKKSFEPREQKKGDIARTMFYFRTIYPTQADNSFFEKQRKTLCQWHLADPVDAGELARSRKVAQTAQGNVNPFTLDSSLPQRTYCP